MTTILLVIIYFIYIGLGVPDSTFGSAWPSIYNDLSLPISSGNLITMLISLCTVTASFFSAKLLNKFGTGLVTAVSTLVSACGLVGFSLSNNMLWLCLSSVPVGLGAGAIDAALNNYVALNYKSIHLNFLHCFYGVGVALSPFVFSLTLASSLGWRGGYRVVFILQIVLSLLAFIALPVWKKIKTKTPGEEVFTPKTLKYSSMAKVKAIRACWVAFFASCGLEFTCGLWSSTYLVKYLSVAEHTADLYLMLFYGGLTFGRLVSGIISTKLSNRRIIYIGYFLVALALLVIALPFIAIVKGIALLFVGFGLGPMFPNMTYLLPKYFGKQCSQSIISSAMVSCNLGILLLPPVFGLIAQHISAGIFPYYALTLFTIMIISTIIFDKSKDSAKNSKIFENI